MVEWFFELFVFLPTPKSIGAYEHEHIGSGKSIPVCEAAALGAAAQAPGDELRGSDAAALDAVGSRLWRAPVSPRAHVAVS